MGLFVWLSKNDEETVEEVCIAQNPNFSELYLMMRKEK